MTATKPDKTVRLSVRVSETERAWLERQAGRVSMSDYIRQRIFGKSDFNVQASGKPRPRRVKGNQQAHAQILALLGQTAAFQHLSDIADAARSGSLVLTVEIEQHLRHASQDITTIKSLLMKALRIKER